MQTPGSQGMCDDLLESQPICCLYYFSQKLKIKVLLRDRGSDSPAQEFILFISILNIHQRWGVMGIESFVKIFLTVEILEGIKKMAYDSCSEATLPYLMSIY
jgi:hypothetical protein